MITGYNTDVRHVETVVHVQTEDKGRGNPYIESVVYVAGRVVATKRSSYAQLLEGGKGDPEIAALMDHQHRTIVAVLNKDAFGYSVEKNEWVKLNDAVPFRATDADTVFAYDSAADAFLLAGLLFAGIALALFVWAARSGQFDDLETPAVRILFDDETPAPAAGGPDKEKP